MSPDIRWNVGPAARLLMAILVALLALGVRLGAQNVRFVAVQDDTCPMRLADLRQEFRLGTLDLVVTGTISNPSRRAAQSLILTAALVDDTGRVTNLHMEPLPLPIGAGTTKPFRAVFENLLPTRGERVIVGIQAIRWSKTDEWRGTVKLVTVPAVLASSGIGR